MIARSDGAHEGFQGTVTWDSVWTRGEQTCTGAGHEAIIEGRKIREWTYADTTCEDAITLDLDESSASPDPETAAQPTGQPASTRLVTILHAVPGADDVYFNLDLALESLEFGTVTDPIELGGGGRDRRDFVVDVVSAGVPIRQSASDEVFNNLASLPEVTNASIVVHPAEDGEPRVSDFLNDVSEVAAGDARLTVRHAAAAPAIDVLVDGEVVIKSLADSDEATLDIPSAAYAFAVAAAGTTDLVLGPLDLTPAQGASTII